MIIETRKVKAIMNHIARHPCAAWRSGMVLVTNTLDLSAEHGMNIHFRSSAVVTQLGPWALSSLLCSGNATGTNGANSLDKKDQLPARSTWSQS